MFSSNPIDVTLPASKICVGWKLWDPIARMWREVLRVENTRALVNVETAETNACFRPMEQARIRR